MLELPRPVRLGALLCGLLLAGCSTEEHAGPRSLLLVTIDTLRADHLSCYGYPRTTSPALDAFLARGLRVERAYSTAPRTAPAHASLLTGLYPSFHSVGHDNATFRLDEGHATLAEHLRAAGLRTGAIVSNPVLRSGTGLEQGFELYDDTFPDVEITGRLTEKLAERTASAAVTLLERWRDEAFFLWVHFQDPHGPYTPPPGAADAVEGPAPEGGDVTLAIGATHAGRGELPRYQLVDDERRLSEYVARYDGEIRYLDGQLARVFGALDRLGLADTTLVALTADHGEAFGEDGYYCAHGHGVGPDQTRVPLAFVGPGVAPGAVVEGPVSNLALFATALELFGLDGADAQQSRSLASTLRTGAEAARRGFAESVTQRAAFGPAGYVRADSHPLSDIAFWERGNPYTRAPYVPLGEPRFEPSGVRGDASRLRASLDGFQQRADRYALEIAAMRRGELVLGDEDLARLRALGYVD